MKPARLARSGRQSTTSSPTDSAAVRTIASSVAGTSAIPSGLLNAYAARAPKARKSP